MGIKSILKKLHLFAATNDQPITSESVEPLQTIAKLDSVHSDRYIYFGEFCIDQAAERVFRGGTQLDIGGKGYAILIILIKKYGQIVMREEIRRALWPADANIDVASNINTSIHNLRQILGDSRSEAIYIETIPRKGYIFNAIPEFSSKASRESSDVFQDASSEKANSAIDTEPLQQASPRAGRMGITMIWVLAGMLLLGIGLATFWVAHVGARSSR